MTPDIHTNRELFIEVGDGHELYVQDWGNPHATDVILSLHGGPGSQSSDKHKHIFDPKQHRVIFFDQRGCGRSLPYGSLKNNTTDNLVHDIVKILDHLKLKQVVVQGGSWGSCLALAFALKHPDRIKALVVRGVFTGSQSEIDWLDKGAFKQFFPDIWHHYVEQTPQSHHKNPSAYHFDRILNGNDADSRTSAYLYGNMEAALLKLDDRFYPSSIEDFDPAGTRIMVHYMANRCFMADRHILKNAHKLAMPVWIVQGRYDVICPPDAAYELHQSIPHSKLVWTIAGHHGSERETFSVLKAIFMQFGQRHGSN